LQEEGRRKKEEGRRKKEEGRRKREEGFSYLPYKPYFWANQTLQNIILI